MTLNYKTFVFCVIGFFNEADTPELNADLVGSGAKYLLTKCQCKVDIIETNN
jgi:hypothetical protein